MWGTNTRLTDIMGGLEKRVCRSVVCSGMEVSDSVTRNLNLIVPKMANNSYKFLSSVMVGVDALEHQLLILQVKYCAHKG